MRSLSSKLKKIAEDNVNNVQKCETEAGSFPTSCLSQSLKFQPLLLDACNLDNIQLFLKNIAYIIIFLCIYCVNYDSRGKTPVETCVGIDLNRNFDFYWNNSGGASAAGCSGYYRGDKPFSEPESQNIEAFVRKRL